MRTSIATALALFLSWLRALSTLVRLIILEVHRSRLFE